MYSYIFCSVILKYFMKGSICITKLPKECIAQKMLRTSVYIYKLMCDSVCEIVLEFGIEHCSSAYKDMLCWEYNKVCKSLVTLSSNWFISEKVITNIYTDGPSHNMIYKSSFYFSFLLPCICHIYIQFKSVASVRIYPKHFVGPLPPNLPQITMVS